MPALNQRFKSSCDYRVAASGRFARGTVLGDDDVGVLPHSTDSSHSLYREVVLTSLHSNRPFLSNTLMEHHPKPGLCPNFCRGVPPWAPRVARKSGAHGGTPPQLPQVRILLGFAISRRRNTDQN